MQRLLTFIVLCMLSGAAFAQSTVTANQGAPGRQGNWKVHDSSTGTSSQEVQGTAADGAAKGSAKPIQVAGQDGTNAQTVKTDTTGRVEVIGGGAVGSAVTAQPVIVGGTDGTNARGIKVDATNNGLITSPLGQTYAPVATTTTLSLSTTSAATAALTTNGCYRITADVDFFYRTGSGTVTAVTTDAPLWAKTIERVCLTGSNNIVAGITASGTGTAYITAIAQTP